MSKIFVYGTLLTGCRNYERYLKDHVFSVQEAYVKGVLYTIKGKDYPALLQGDRLIRGEILDIDPSLLPILDDLEGYYGENDPRNEYIKIESTIYDQSKRILACLPVYFYNPFHPLQIHSCDKIILSNDYRKWLYEHSDSSI